MELHILIYCYLCNNLCHYAKHKPIPFLDRLGTNPIKHSLLHWWFSKKYLTIKMNIHTQHSRCNISTFYFWNILKCDIHCTFVSKRVRWYWAVVICLESHPMSKYNTQSIMWSNVDAELFDNNIQSKQRFFMSWVWMVFTLGHLCDMETLMCKQATGNKPHQTRILLNIYFPKMRRTVFD